MNHQQDLALVIAFFILRTLKGRENLPKNAAHLHLRQGILLTHEYKSSGVGKEKSSLRLYDNSDHIDTGLPLLQGQLPLLQGKETRQNCLILSDELKLMLRS